MTSRDNFAFVIITASYSEKMFNEKYFWRKKYDFLRKFYALFMDYKDERKGYFFLNVMSSILKAVTLQGIYFKL